MRIKIIEEKKLKEFEKSINEFLFLIEWFNKEPFYFKKEYHHRKHRAIIVFKSMELSTEVLAIRSFEQNDLLKKDSKLEEKLTSYLNKFYPERKIERVAVNNKEE